MNSVAATTFICTNWNDGYAIPDQDQTLKFVSNFQMPHPHTITRSWFLQRRRRRRRRCTAQAQAVVDFGCYMKCRQRDKRNHSSKHCITIGSAALLSNRIEFDHSNLSRIKWKKSLYLLPFLHPALCWQNPSRLSVKESPTLHQPPPNDGLLQKSFKHHKNLSFHVNRVKSTKNRRQ